MTSFDIIGDIHGQNEKLEALLRQMGYAHRNGAWRHPSRKAMFAGDYVDRGPGQLATLRIVRDMVEAGSAEAILGNHEFNAIAFHAVDPLNASLHLRVRNEKNRRQHVGFLNEVGEDTELHETWIKWFMTLPLWIEKDDFRVVHACWHAPSMSHLAGVMGQGNTLTPRLVELASRPQAKEFGAVETLCKGLEIALPEGVSYFDGDGNRRVRTRIRWWDETATTYKQAAMIGSKDADQLPDTPIPAESRMIYDQEKPVFFGHYWFTGQPQVLSSKTCCVDYSAARNDHPLVAYRFDGESELTSDNLVSSQPLRHFRPR